MPPEPFTVTCHAGFDESGFWLIDAQISWRDGPPPIGSALLGRGRLALLRTIAKAGLQGRSLGATRRWIASHPSAEVSSILAQQEVVMNKLKIVGDSNGDPLVNLVDRPGASSDFRGVDLLSPTRLKHDGTPGPLSDRDQRLLDQEIARMMKMRPADTEPDPE
jgi:hypothetical protein